MNWFDTVLAASGDRNAGFVAMCRGMVSVTRDGPEYTLWIYDYPLIVSDKRTVFRAYADLILDDPILKKVYRR